MAEKPKTDIGASHSTAKDNFRRSHQESVSKRSAFPEMKRDQAALSPISWIPAETLSDVFILVRKASDEGGWYDGRKWHSVEKLNWINVSYVNQWWREVALGTPNLWTNIPADSPKWASEMIKRSKDMPLVFNVTFTDSLWEDPTNENAESTVRHLSRIQELNLRNISRARMRDLLPYTGVLNAPRMETLRMVADDKLPNYPLSDANTQAPCLRRFATVGWPVVWSSKFLRNLTHLRISDLQPDSDYRPLPKDFLETLRHMPNLESLYVENGFSLRGWAYKIEDESMKVHLPRLKVLRLDAPSLQVVSILQSINVPPSMTLSILCDSYEGPNEITDILTIFSTFPTHFPSAALSNDQGNSIKSLSLIMSNGCAVKGWPLEVLPSEMLARTVPRMCLESRFSVTGNYKANNYARSLRTMDFIQPLFRSLYLDHLVVLEIQEILDAKTWAETFGSLPALREIFIRSCGVQELFEALTYGVSYTSPERPSSLPFPSLKSISIVNVHFTETLPQKIYERLVDRFEFGVEIHDLAFWGCSAGPIWVQLYREVIANEVCWEEKFEPKQETSRYPIREYTLEVGDHNIRKEDVMMGVWF